MAHGNGALGAGLLIAACCCLAACGSTHREARRPAPPRELGETAILTACASPQSQREMETCAAAEQRELVRAEDAEVSRVKALLTGTELRAFDEAESAWRRYTDLQCAAVLRRYEGGSMASAASLECRNTLMRQRIDALRRLYSPDQH